MPFQDYKGFDLDTMRNMTAAYDAAIAKLKINSNDPLRATLAAKIVVLARAGVRDPTQLCEIALKEIKKR
jgi:hypothetical protein